MKHLKKNFSTKFAYSHKASPTLVRDRAIVRAQDLRISDVVHIGKRVLPAADVKTVCVIKAKYFPLMNKIEALPSKTSSTCLPPIIADVNIACVIEWTE